MFGTLGGPELILIGIIALIVFGPRKLPEIGKSVGKMIFEFRKASADFQRTIQDEVEADRRRAAAPAAPAALPAPPPPAEAPAASPEAAAPAAAPEGTVSRAAAAPEGPPIEPNEPK